MNTIKNNLFLLKKIAIISPLRVFNSFLYQILRNIVWAFFTVVFMRYLFGADDIMRPFSDVAMFLIATSVAMFFISLYNAWHDHIFVKREDQIITFALNRELFDKAVSVDISCYENPSFYNDYTKATMEVFTRAQSVLFNCANFLGALISSIFVISTVVFIDPVAGVFMFTTFIGSFFFGRVSNRLNYNRYLDGVPYERRINYVNRVIYLPQYAKEMRLTEIFHVLWGIYDEAIVGKFKTYDKYWKWITVTHSLRGLLCYSIVFQGMWVYAAYLVMVRQSIQIGDFIVLSSAIVSVTWMLKGVSDSIIEAGKNANYIENLKSFLLYAPKINENQQGLPVTVVDTLEFRKVCFRYSAEGCNVLRDINMILRAGEKIALVGHNGAGKTTLIKLIMRLYDPTEGEILLNGVDIRKYNLQEYRNIIGSTFQDYQIFSLSVLENVIMKRLETHEEKERAIEALKQSNAYDMVKTLSDKEYTILTREFDNDGIVLSGGEYQKIATARAFAKNAQILIMDEPSSALDPIAEHLMHETIMDLCERKENKDNIAVIISHRLSSASRADYVYMLEKGEIIEFGTYKSLLEAGRAYSDMYFKQSKSYLSEGL